MNDNDLAAIIVAVAAVIGVGLNVRLGAAQRQRIDQPVADLDETIAKVKANGGTVLFGPVDIPGGGRIANCTDPQGAAFALHWRA